MKSEILTLLREGMRRGNAQDGSQEYISGQELCSRFGVSRTAVWKVMNQLKAEGYEIEAVQNKGYRLKASPDVVGEDEIKSRFENRGEGHYVVIGCGINVNQMDFPEEISATATSLALEKGERITRSALLLSIMEHFEKAYDKLRETWELTALLPAYHSYLLNKDARVRVLDPKGEFCGTARGINEAGELLVEKEDGELARVYAGEVSVRGVYGYV